MKILSWILVPFAAVFGLVLTAYIVFYPTQPIFMKFCPPEFVFHNTCEAQWFEWVGLIQLIIFIALAPIAYIILPSLLAPSHRHRVAVTIYSIGVILMVIPSAGLFVIQTLGIGLITGFLAIRFVDKFLVKNKEI